MNQALSVEEYPLPTPDEIFASLSNGKVFSKLDLSQAYLQLPMDDESKPYLTINTHQGLQPTPLWCGFRTSNFSEDDGHCPTWNHWSRMLY